MGTVTISCFGGVDAGVPVNPLDVLQLATNAENPSNPPLLPAGTNFVMITADAPHMLAIGAAPDALTNPSFHIISNEPFGLRVDAQAGGVKVAACEAGGDYPTMIEPPYLYGSNRISGQFSFEVGIYSFETDKQAKITAVNNGVTRTVMDWQPVTPDPVLGLIAQAGDMLIPHVRTVVGGVPNPVIHTGAAFGPMSDEEVVIAISNAPYTSHGVEFLHPTFPTPTSTVCDEEFVWNATHSGQLNSFLPNDGTTVNKWGYSSQFYTHRTSFTEPRVNNRMSLTTSTYFVRADLNNPTGELRKYRLYTVYNQPTSPAVANVGFRLVDGANVEIAKMRVPSVASGEYMHASGTISNVTDWQNASDFGGEPLEFQTTANHIKLGRYTDSETNSFNFSMMVITRVMS